MTLVDDHRVARLRTALLRWARSGLRDTPWRRTRDPWRVLVSETMLQQTQVDRVLPRYEAFVTRFDDPAACAAAPRGDVIRAWEGLGYNRRAVALHRTAAIIVDDHGGAVPEDLDDLLALPGVGPYTARAVRVFALGAREAVVDVNVDRVLRRAVVGDPLAAVATQALADDLVESLDDEDVWTWNQAVMELGARWCRKRSPHCQACPLVAECAWAGVGEDPAAGVGSTQSRFEGSDRQGRGRLVAALRAGPIPESAAGDVVGWADRARTDAVVAALVADGLVRREHGVLSLPDHDGG